MINLMQLIWPHNGLSLENDTSALVGEIDAAYWSTQQNIALDQARNIADKELERRSSAETKAGIFLAGFAAIFPLLTFFVEALGRENFAQGPLWLRVFGTTLLFVGILYVAAAAFRAFQALKVSTFCRVDVEDVVGNWPGKKFERNLTKSLLRTSVQNRAFVNKKISYILLSERLILRAAIVFALLLVVLLIGRDAIEFFQYVKSSLCK